MLLEDIREYCLSLPDVEEGMPFGNDTLVFKVWGKIFLICSLDKSPLQFNVKCEPSLAIELREKFLCVLPGFHMNKKHWNTIVVDDSLSDKIIEKWILHSYELVAKSRKK
jgi:predicted DNA-binding protein (MmcQ/YjbR family)